MPDRLGGRVAIVTGGGHGIGKAYSRALAAAGASVVVADVDGAAAAAVASELGTRGHSVRADVADEGSTRAMAESALARLGRIDILVNNAAIFATIPITRGTIEEITVEEWDRVMAVNLRGVFLACRAVLPAMKHQRYGKIVNISSGTALSGSPTRIHYVASKGAVLSFTRTLGGSAYARDPRDPQRACRRPRDPARAGAGGHRRRGRVLRLAGERLHHRPDARRRRRRSAALTPARRGRHERRTSCRAHRHARGAWTRRRAPARRDRRTGAY
ncbi:MAG: SDR family NAD(P)-dependent oxidoreductase [Chloroflexi bacterium]|nr:MAG: SDR family NAD(P)-dependent oxidoreductase [Chloroflexota bacterium]